MGSRHESPKARRRGTRRGLALMDVMVAGVMLGTGLAVIISLTSRSMAVQTAGERRLVASWLADELLSMVLVEGPDAYGRLHDVSGTFASPFEQFDFEVAIARPDVIGVPWGVSAIVSWEGPGDPFVAVDTTIALRGGDEEPPREPFEPVDREARWYEDELGPPGSVPGAAPGVTP